MPVMELDAPEKPASVVNPIAIAFNRGADARLAGKPLKANPYRYGFEPYERKHWKWGWMDVAKHWGVDARWRVRPLRQVQHG